MLYFLIIFWNKEERKLEKGGVRVCEYVYETHLKGRRRSLIWPLTYHIFGVNREGCAAGGTPFSDILPCRKLPCAVGTYNIQFSFYWLAVNSKALQGEQLLQENQHAWEISHDLLGGASSLNWGLNHLDMIGIQLNALKLMENNFSFLV